MMIRNRILLAILSLALLAGSVGSGQAETPEDESGTASTSAEAVVTSVGEFDAFFCNLTSIQDELEYTVPAERQLQLDAPPTATNAGRAHGTLEICYIDTHLWRAGFEVQVSTGPFTASDSPSNTPIVAANLSITRTHGVAQVQHDQDGFDVGDIGSFGESGSVVQDSQPVSWSGANRSLDVGRYVQFGSSGAGTTGSTGSFDVELIIPAGTAPGTYSSTMTLTIMPSRLP